MNLLKSASLLAVVVLCGQAQAATSCSIYNDYIDSQCVELNAQEKSEAPEVFADYSVSKCRHEAILMIFDSNKSVQKECVPTKLNGKYDQITDK